MTGRVDFVAAIMCDDIRHEIDGGISLMGVSSPDFQVQAFPARKRASFGLLVNTLEPGEVQFTLELSWKGERRWAVETTMLVADIGNGVIVPHEGTVAGFDTPGELTLTVEYEGVVKPLQTWTVEGPEKADPAD